MRQLLLHIGTHKTGSTAIQRALEDKAKTLLREDIVALPMFPQARDFTFLTERSDALVQSCRAYLLAEDAKLEDPVQRLVMSYEGFCGNPYAGYDNAILNAPMLREITEGFDTHVVVYLRRQDAFIESLYTQSTHRGQSATFEDFLQRIHDADYDWYRLIDHFAQQFGRERIIVRLYDRSTLIHTNSLMESFAEVLGSEEFAAGDSTYIVNPGYSKQATELARSVNPHLSHKEQKRLRYILQTTMAKKPLEEYTYFNSAARQAVLERYADSNARVARDYLGRASGELFSPPELPNEGHDGRATDAVSDGTEARELYSRLSGRSRLLLLMRQIQRMARQLKRHLSRSAS